MKPFKLFLSISLASVAVQLSSRADESYGGVGIDVGVFKEPDGIEIFDVYPHSAAQKAGIYRYQQIRSIDGVPMDGKTRQECLQRLRGKVGSIVTLELADPVVGKTNIVSLVRERIDVVDVSLDRVVKTNGFVNANRDNYTADGRAFVRLAQITATTNQVLWVATTNGGIAGIRFTGGHSGGSTTNIHSNTVEYCWNYRATSTSRLLTGTNSATEIFVYTEVRPNRWEGKLLGKMAEHFVNAGDVVGLSCHWRGGGEVGVAYDASMYRVRVDDLPSKQKRQK